MHLTDEAILELAGNRLSTGDLHAVDEHLAVCEACRKRCSDLRFAHSVFERLADVELKEAMHGAALIHNLKLLPREFAFPWGWVSAIVLGCACFLIVLFTPSVVPQASASELLADAMQSEGHFPAAKAFRIQIGGESCARGAQNNQLDPVANSDRCNKGLQHLKASRWGRGNPLSVRTYAEWHGSLRQRHDNVTKRDASWEVTTTTDDGLVHEAHLEMRTSDYHPTKLTLDFEDNEEICIFESTEPSASSDIATRITTPTAQIVDNPADRVEVEAWITLHKLGADSGWEATLLRNSSQVEVEVIADNEERQHEILAAFASLPEIVVRIHSSSDSSDQSGIWPTRLQPDGNGPGLAEKWLEQQFSAADARESYNNNTFQVSRQLIGRAFFIDRLQQRRKALAHCSCASDLSTLVKTEEQNMHNLQSELSSVIEPLIGASAQLRGRALTLTQTRELDLALQELFFRSNGPNQDDLDTRVQEVRNTL